MASSLDFSQQVRQIADQLSAGGVAALGMLYDLTAQRLVRFAVTVSYHQQDAEDAVQAVLTRLATNPQLLKDANCPWSYLLRMVRNQVIAMHRQQQRCSAAGDLSDLITHCPIDEAEREESFRAIWVALRSLPPEQAEVVVLKIWEEMTFAQIGEVLEISPNTVASRYQYGLTKLSNRLTKQPTRGRRHV